MLLALLSTALAAPGGLNILPFGVGVYAHGRPVRGVVYTVTQAAGITALSYGTVKAYDAAAAEDDDTFSRWQGVTMAGVTVAAASYLVSVLDGSRLHELEEKGDEARDSVRRWDAAVADRAVADRAVADRAVAREVR